MKKLDLEQFNELLDSSKVKQKLKDGLKFITSTSSMTGEDWQNTELLSIKDKSGNKGILLITIASDVYVLPYELGKLSPSSSTGRSSAIVCDFCMTWQSGTRAGSILFPKVRSSTSNIGYLCCGDLACSMHVRTKTSASKISRAQLREDMDDLKRINRLTQRLESLTVSLGANPVN